MRVFSAAPCYTERPRLARLSRRRYCSESWGEPPEGYSTAPGQPHLPANDEYDGWSEMEEEGYSVAGSVGMAG